MTGFQLLQIVNGKILTCIWHFQAAIGLLRSRIHWRAGCRSSGVITLLRSVTLSIRRRADGY